MSARSWSRVGAVAFSALLPLGWLAPAGEAAPVAGGSSIGDSLFPTIGNTGYDVKHYAIALTYDRTAKSITATTSVEAKASRALSSFSLDLEGLTVDSVRVDGKVATFTRKDTKLVVTPAKKVSGHFTTVVAYHGVPTTHLDPDGAKDGWVPTADGATVLSEPVGAMTWFPNNNTPRDKATYDIAVTVPADLEVASNGILKSQRVRAGAKTWAWQQKKAMSSYLAMISIAQYDVYTSSTKLRSGKKIPIWSFISPDLTKDGKKDTLAEQRNLIPEIIRFQEKRYGRYPFASAGIVVKEINVGYALETQDRPFFDGTPDDSTLVHEIAHQWYGDSVTAKDWGDIWLHEGFASYAEDQWAAAHGGPSTKAAFQERYDANGPDADLWSPAVVGFDDPADLFGNPVYVRGGMTLEALRQKVGNADFNTILRKWADQNRYDTVTTKDFIKLSERVSHRDLRSFFKVWLYTPARPAGY